MRPGDWALLRILQEGPLRRDDWRLVSWQIMTGIDVAAAVRRLLEDRLIAVRGTFVVCSHLSLFSGFSKGKIYTADSHDEGRLKTFLGSIRDENLESSNDARDATRAYQMWRDIRGLPQSDTLIRNVWIHDPAGPNAGED
jgi:hypothetical protein